MAGSMNGQAPWRAPLWGGALLLLLAPAAAMLVTQEVNWEPGDFLAFGALLLMACAGIEAAIRFGKSRAARLGLVLAVVAGALLLWVELAVGILGPG